MRVIIAAVAVVLLSACFNTTTPTDLPPEVPAPSFACTVRNADPHFDVPDAQAQGDSGVALDGEAQRVEAGVDASTAPDYAPCKPPPGVCADAQWVAYFDDGRCTNGTCNFVTKYHFCPQGCSGGLCAQRSSGFAGGTPPSSGPPPKW